MATSLTQALYDSYQPAKEAHAAMRAAGCSHQTIANWRPTTGVYIPAVVIADLVESFGAEFRRQASM